MCGIIYKSSFYNQPDYNRFIKAANTLNHRGPDEEGFLFTNNHLFGAGVLGEGSWWELSIRASPWLQARSSVIITPRL